jgi:two-component system, LytTR family, sensor kinase
VQRGALLNFDWEMMTYWAIVGISHAVLYYRESRDRAVRASQLETQLVEARLVHAPAAAPPALPLQHAARHLGADAPRRRGCRTHAGALSDLLRLTLDRLGQQEIPLEAELEFLGKYLEIEQTRFADRLVVTFDVQPETLDVFVPTLLLQPLVENALKHGIARKAGPGRIDITTRRSNGHLWIEVRDDGAGLSDTALDALQKGIGVSTTRAGCSTSSAPTTGSNSTACPRGSRSSSRSRGGAPAGTRLPAAEHSSLVTRRPGAGPS